MVTLVAARYWRFVLTKSTYSGQNTYIQVGTLRMVDGTNTPIAHSAVTSSGAVAPFYGTAANVGDSDGTTYATWARTSNNWAFGDIAIDYDFGSDVLPAGFLFRQRKIAQYYAPFGGTYTPAYLEAVQIYVLSSADNINWHQVGFYPNVYGTIEDVETITLLPNVLDNYYVINTIKPYSGDGGIYGIVSEDGVPVSRPLFLLERDFFSPIKRTLSNADGGYAFEGLNTDRKFCVLAVDTTEETPGTGVYKNALVRDRITPIKANGVPSGGAPWFFRYRSTMLQPNFAVGFYGPGDVTAKGAHPVALWAGPLYEPNNGGYDLRGLSLPTHLTGYLRLLYPKHVNPPVLRGPYAHRSSTNGAFTVETIVEVPSGTDPATVLCFGGVRTGDYGWNNGTRCTGAVFLEMLNTGVINVRAWFTGSNTLNTIRTTGSATPGSIVHIVLAYTENSHFKLYLNGTLANTGNLAGLGTIYSGLTINEQTTWNYGAYIASDSYYGAYSGNLWAISAFSMGGGVASRYTCPSAPATGVAWAASYPYDLSTTPDAAGVPIAIRDLYTTYISDSVWVGGSRPNGWPAAPSYTGYGIEVAADAPVLWARMQETSNANAVSTHGMMAESAFGWYTLSGCDFAQTGMTNGMQSVRFNQGGALRLYGLRGSRLGRPVLQDMVSGTIELWYTPESRPASEAVLFSAVNSANNTLRMQLSATSTGNLRFTFSDTAAQVFALTIPGVVLSLSTAYHIAISWDPIVDQRFKLYIDGTAVYDVAFLVQSNRYNTHWPSEVIIGNIDNWSDTTTEPYNTSVVAGTTNHARGLIQDVAVYSYVLPANRIAAHYAARTY